ncbi:acetolactate synthase-1/2/3 large subunit [Lentzea atacamensis]|uniref:Acetolactate synthase-1/2/3 large subunit n=2 Tax=Lentzea TaxID=165301 RepID=A0A316HBI1_9PSEU|nr:thiamine pyrophosphate-dependent enzyme [Lentzea atacamensis]PWK78559.1 acetolactate synthase-1/2/3 large subunit [Lentzea atacamensis]
MGAVVNDYSGNTYLIDMLRQLGVTLYAGVNGGGVIHLAKLMVPVRTLSKRNVAGPSLLTVPEYTAGFVPLGHYLATGQVAACLTTTGAATKLAASGLSDAKAHNIPAVYVVALNSTSNYGRSPLQDVSDEGAHIVAQLRDELGEACFHVTDLDVLPKQIIQAQGHLAQCRPVAFAVHPDVLAGPMPAGSVPAVYIPDPPSPVFTDVTRFRQVVEGRRVVLLVTDEAARDPRMPVLTTEIAATLGAPVLWTANGAAGVAADNPYGYGHVGFGGNDAATTLWNGLQSDDVLITLGFEPGEYVLGLAPVAAGDVIHLTEWEAPFGHRNGGFAHRCSGRYWRLGGPIFETARALIIEAGTVRQLPAPAHLNTDRPNTRHRADTVDFAAFLERLHSRWRVPSLGFDDVSMVYKDRPYVTQRPHPLMRTYTAYQGSAMGGAFGLAVGARIADPTQTVYCFSGDGCYRLYAGALPETARLGLRLFIINNGSYALVEQGLRHVLPDTSEDRFHSQLAPVDHVAAARAYGWDAFRVKPDLSNLDEILDACQTSGDRSLLVDVPVDASQNIGPNPRVRRAVQACYL